MIQTKKRMENNKGSAVVEATLCLPIFIIAMLALYSMIQTKFAECSIYETAIETAEYMAEYGYLDTHGYVLPNALFKQYLDDDTLVDKYVEDGINGISFFGTVPVDSDGYVQLVVEYAKRVSIPFFSPFSKKSSFTISQKAYLGDAFSREVDNSEVDEEEVYVYITENREVYHKSRSCTYLLLSIRKVLVINAENDGYTPCEFCGDAAEGRVYITDYGKRFHSNMHCSGLKRTVTRVKLSDVSDLPPCSRCGEGE